MAELQSRSLYFIIFLVSDAVRLFKNKNIYRKQIIIMETNQLKDTDKIVYSISPETKRDFISIKSVCKVLNRVVQQQPHGIYNLSSNYGLPIGDVARSLIEGYGSGEFISTSTELKDQFVLDNTKLIQKLNIELPIFQRKYIKKLGEKL